MGASRLAEDLFSEALSSSLVLPAPAGFFE
jgi:hypothetical protein